MTTPKFLVGAAHKSPASKDLPGAAPGRTPAAVVVAHGMGQQVPFETLDALVSGFGKAARRLAARTVVVGGERLHRLEAMLALPDGSSREIHFYEAYWAPLTEGQLRLRDVMSFLLRSGAAGVRQGLSPFRRRLFDEYAEFPAPASGVLSLVAALVVFAALIFLNALVVTIVVARVPLRMPPPWLGPGLFSDVTAVLAPLVITFLFLALCLWLSRALRHVSWLRRVLGALSIAALALASCATVAAALAAAAVVVYHAGWNADGPLLVTNGSLSWWFGLAWPTAVAASVVVRSFLIQYVGDVTAYVQPQVLDRFFYLRQRIKEAVLKTTRAVYAGPYDDIVLVGHSLGSVVLYDVLNRLLVDEELGVEKPLAVAGRTRLLLTFGSPLDKTAFVFGTMARQSEARDSLAASLQPLIRDPQVRPPWINIYSPWDLISGALDYYDLPDRSNARPVDNVRDWEATTLVLSHVEYWTSPLLFATILNYLGGGSATAE